VVNGSIHHFGVVGLSNGLAVMADEETRTLWDHITGEAFEGPLAGKRLDWWPIRLTTTSAALVEWPAVPLLVSDYRSIPQRVMGRLQRRKIHTKGWLPPGFRATMSAPVDPRLDEMTQGLGVIVDDEARFYPMDRIPAGGLEDAWHGRTVRVVRGARDGVLAATWADDADGEIPMQLLTRWYGFSFTYPRCRIVPEG
jgi:hypothetical protein